MEKTDETSLNVRKWSFYLLNLNTIKAQLSVLALFVSMSVKCLLFSSWWSIFSTFILKFHLKNTETLNRRIALWEKEKGNVQKLKRRWQKSKFIEMQRLVWFWSSPQNNPRLSSYEAFLWLSEVSQKTHKVAAAASGSNYAQRLDCSDELIKITASEKRRCAKSHHEMQEVLVWAGASALRKQSSM